jgi:hypothetical protein
VRGIQKAITGIDEAIAESAKQGKRRNTGDEQRDQRTVTESAKQ